MMYISHSFSNESFQKKKFHKYVIISTFNSHIFHISHNIFHIICLFHIWKAMKFSTNISHILYYKQHIFLTNIMYSDIKRKLNIALTYRKHMWCKYFLDTMESSYSIYHRRKEKKKKKSSEERCAKMCAQKKTTGIWCKMSYYIQHEVHDRFHAIVVHSLIQSVTMMFLLHFSRLCFIYVKVTNQKFRDVFTWVPSCSGAVFPLNLVYFLTLTSTAC